MLKKLNKKIHISWLIAWFSAALIGGIALAFWWHNPIFASWQILLAVFALLFITFLKRTKTVVILAIAAGLLLGLWRGSHERLATAGYQKYIGQVVTLSAVISDDVTHKNGAAGMKLKNVQVNNQSIGGQVWASASSSENLERDDKVWLNGKLAPGFGTFAASMSYAKLKKVAYPAIGDIPRETRNKFTAGVENAIPEPEAMLGIGYLTGQHNNLPATLTQQLALVGLIHLVIAGGYNVTILVRFARRGFGKISKYLALFASSAVLLGITLMAGFTPPMARTAFVTGLCLATWYYGRKIHPLVLLPVAAAATAVVVPSFVWGDVGWYLTFIAYGGLIILAPMIKQLLWKEKEAGMLKQIFVDTLAVQIVTMPLIAFAFGQYSIYGLPANLLVLPLMPLTMLATAIAGVGGMFLPAGLAHIVGWPATQLLGYTYKVTMWLANAQGANVSANFAAPALLISYLLAILLIFILWRKTKFNFVEENMVE